MHATARFLTENNAFQQCTLLRGREPAEENNGRVWKLPLNMGGWLNWTQTAAASVPYDIWEQRFDNEEKRVLEAWLRADLEALQSNPRAGDPSPNTLIARFESWLRDQPV